MIFSADDTCDVGTEGGALVAEDYPVPNALHRRGQLGARSTSATPPHDADHMLDPDELLRVAMARQ